jgi:hypothetical protein
MAATAHAPRPGRLRIVQEAAARLIPAGLTGAHSAHPEAEAGEGR